MKYRRKRRKSLAALIVIALLYFYFTPCCAETAGTAVRSDEWPQFGLVFQEPKDYTVAAQRFGFSWDNHQRVQKLVSANSKGVYLRYYNLTQTSALLSKKFQPDYDYIMGKHPEWLLRKKDGSLVLGPVNNPCLDIGNPQYVAWVINWLKEEGFNGKDFRGHLALDCGMFMHGNPQWSKYTTDKAYRDAWEFFLKSISNAFRPQYKVVLNVGSSDLPTFARMVRWVDGVLFEGLGLANRFDNPKFIDLSARRSLILDKMQKGRWCVENGKIWAQRVLSTIRAIEFASNPGSPLRYLSIDDREISILGPNHQTLGKISLNHPDTDTLGKVTESLRKYNLKPKLVNPYPESSPLGAFQPVNQIKVENGLTLKLKRAPKEAFLFGYAVVLMAGGANSYFILADGIHFAYYYPEMDWALGGPQGDMRLVAPDVYRRDYKFYSAFLNLSAEPFRLPNLQLLLPMRGALIPVVK